MNKTFKTIWNAVRSAYVTVNETVAGASQRGSAAKAVVLSLTAAAALTTGSSVSAAWSTEYPWWDPDTELYTSAMEGMHVLNTGDTSTFTEEIVQDWENEDTQPDASRGLYVRSLYLLEKTKPTTLTLDGVTNTVNFLRSDATNVAVAGNVIDADSGSTINIIGENVVLTMTNETSAKTADFLRSTVINLAEREYSDVTDKAAVLKISAASTTLNASLKSVNGGGTSVSGISAKQGSTITLAENSVLNINVDTNADSQTGVRDSYEDYYEAYGIRIDNGILTTNAGSKLNIHVTSTGTTEKAAHAFGINGDHAGSWTLNGDTSVTIDTANGRASGILFASVDKDELPVGAEAQVVGTVNGQMDITVKADTAEAIGLAVGIDPLVIKEAVDAGEELDQADWGEAFLTVNGDLIIKVNSSSSNAYGITVGNNDAKTADCLVLSGKTEVTAAKALAGMGYLTVNNDLVLNGAVNEFLGRYEQTAGNVVLNTDTFFNGVTTSSKDHNGTFIKGGSFTAEKSFYDTSDKKARVFKINNHAVVKLAGMHIGDFGQDLTYAKIYDGDVTLSTLTIEEGGKLGFNKGTLCITGTANNKGSISTTAIDETSGQKPDNSEATLVVSGTFTNSSTATVDVDKVEVTSGSKVWDEGDINFREALINGTWVTSSQELTKLDGSEAELLMKVSGGESDRIMTFAGGHISSVASNGTAQVKAIEIGNNISLTYSSGDYAYKTLKIESSANGADSFTVEGANVAVDTFTLTTGSAAVKSGSFEVGKLDISSGTLTLSDSGKLITSSDQVFTTGLGANGTEKTAGSLKYGSDKLILSGGSLNVNDAKYNLDYQKSAAALVKGASLAFTGELVDQSGEVLDKIDINEVAEGTIHVKTDIEVSASETGDKVTVDKSVGGQTIIVAGNANSLEIAANKNLTIVGTADGSKELVSFTSEGQKSVDIKGTLTLGSTDTDTSGKLSATVNPTKETTGGLTVQDGKFNLDKVTAVNGKITVQAGDLTLGRLDVSTDAGQTQISVNEGAKVTVGELAAKAGEHIITGAVEAGKVIENAGDAVKEAVIHVGTNTKKGELTIKDGLLKGIKFFLDPTWKDGMGVTDASKLLLAQTSIDGSIIVGQNSYAALGTTDAFDFVKLFDNGTLTWSNNGGTLAAAYVAKPITITAMGSLVVDASLTAVPDEDPQAGSVTFAKDSVLVANVENFSDNAIVITADSFEIDPTSKAVVIAKAGQTFQLTSDDEVNKTYWNNAGNTLISANKLVSFNVGADGKITTEAEDAEDVFAGLMQGATLANAGAASDNEAVKSYAEALLTDTTGKKSNAQIAREFDAAMNPAGTLGVFTTAKDRSTELRDAVRAHAGNGTANGLWAQVTGGKTKLKGISTGAQDLDLDTDAYGLAVGGEAAVQNITLGAAFMGGSGKTENDSVAGKDDFNYYGLSLYAKTQVQGIDLEGDVSAAWLKSDLTVGGTADVDTDTTTAVYSLGIQAKKTFNLGVDVTPFIGMDVYHIKSDGFTTNHGVSIEDANATIVEFPIGAEVKKAFQTSSGFSVAPSFSLAVVPTVGSKDIDSKVRFAGAESTYNFTFADDVKVRSQLGIEAQKDNFTLGLAAGYDWGNEERSAASVQLRAKYAF